MSSRNVRLDQTSRERSLVLYRALTSAALSLDIDTARTSMQSVSRSQEGFTLDYAEIIDEQDFSKAIDATLNKRAIIAGWLNGVRLIDNMEMKLGAVR
jgi:pantoate--beta-alanine ligase